MWEEQTAAGRRNVQAELKARMEQAIRCKSVPDAAADALLWELLAQSAGQPFRTAKGLEFRYLIRGNEMFVSRKDKSITYATVMLAFHTALALQAEGTAVSGPKKLRTFGASYLYPVFCALGVIGGAEAQPTPSTVPGK